MSKKSESPKTQTDTQELKATQSSYWLTPEEIKDLHKDAQRGLELGRQLRKQKNYCIPKPYSLEPIPIKMTGPDPIKYGETTDNLQQE